MAGSFDNRRSRARCLQQHQPDWIFVWLGLAAWMACLGIVLWSQGINKLNEARYLSREVKSAAAESAFVNHQIGKGEPAAEVSQTNELAPPGSVTDRTTELLNR